MIRICTQSSLNKDFLCSVLVLIVIEMLYTVQAS